MGCIKDMRIAIGLSQEQLADYLEISRSQLASVETGRRDAKHLANMRLADLAIFLDKPAHAMAADRPKEAEQLATALQMRASYAKELDYRKKKAGRELEALQIRYQQQVLRYHFIQHLRQTDTHAQPKPHTSWLDLREMEALKEIEHNGLHVQAMLGLKIASMERELELLGNG